MDSRKQAKLNRLSRHRKCAGDDRLARDDSRDCRQSDQRQLQRGWAEVEEWIGLRLARAVDDQCGLSSII